VFQRLIPTGERSGLLTHIAGDGKRFVVPPDEKLTRLLSWNRQSALAAILIDKQPRFFQTRRDQTDLNQAVDISPLGSSPLPDPRIAEST
jgi:hypothetical protein